MNIWMDAGEYQPMKRSQWKIVLEGIFYGFVCLTALGLGSYRGLHDSNPLMSAAIVGRLNPFHTDPFKGYDEYFILVLGTDVDYDDRGRVVSDSARADSIQLIRFDFVNTAVGVLGIPRDTYIELSGYKPMKINELHKVGGREAVAQAVTQLTGINPDRVVEINFEFVKRAVDAVGGLDIFVNKRLYYVDRSGDLYIDFKPGRQHMDGTQALGFVRFRHSDSEVDRAKRQQDFLIAFKRRVAQNPQYLPELSKIVMDMLKQYFDEEEVVSLAEFVRTVPTTHVRHASLPVRDGPMHPKFYYYPIWDKIPQTLIDAGLRTEAPTGTSVSLR